MINFTGLEWCGNCTQLEEVFTNQDFAPAAESFVLVRLDYPPSPSGDGKIVDRLPQEPPAPNIAWRETYNVGAFPTVFLADATGRPYAVTGNNGMEPAAYLKHVRQLRKIHDKRDAGFAAAAKLDGVERAKALADTLKALEASFANQTDIYTADPLVQFYRPEIDTVMRIDGDNAAGLRRHFNDVLHAEEHRADEAAFYRKLRATLKEIGPDAELQLLDKRIADAETVEVRNNARCARMVSLEWSKRNEEALTAARELAADESYSAEDRRFFRSRVAYNLARIHRDDEALATYDELIAEAGNDPQQVYSVPLHDKADLILEPANRFSDALDVWNAAVKLVKPDKPEWRDAQWRRMHLLARLGRADDAWAAYNDLVRSKFVGSLERAGCLADMAEMFDLQGSHAAAIDAAAKAQQILNHEGGDIKASVRAELQRQTEKIIGAKSAEANETTVPANSKP